MPKVDTLPNAFYDLIVFASSTILAALGFLIGLGFVDGDWLKDLSTLNAVLIAIGILFLGYEYGRMAEAWSSVIVQTPLKELHHRRILLRDPDFLAPLPEVEPTLNLPDTRDGRKGGKWTVYMYAAVVSPRLGSDLLKRYAWEKLSRNSAFTFCLLLGISLYHLITPDSVHLRAKTDVAWTFGSIELTIVLAILAVAAYYEYYRRNCWNNDLLMKALPVLTRAEELLRIEPESSLRAPHSDFIPNRSKVQP